MTRREALTRLATLTGGLILPFFRPEALFAQVFELNVKGQDLLAKGKIVEAIKVLRKAVAEDERNERSWSLLARAYAASGDPGGALACYRKALAINPRDSLTRMMVDMLRQNPLPKPRDPALARQERKGGGRLSELEKAAEAERKAAMAGEAAAPAAPKPWRLVIDPGHGGDDFGCDAQNGLYEKRIALDVALRAARALYALCPQAEIYLTRMGDYAVPGYVRALCASLYGADLFVSIHASCSQSPERSGMTVYVEAAKPSDEAAGETAVLENRALAASGGTAVPGRVEDMAQTLLLRHERALRQKRSEKAAAAFLAKLPGRTGEAARPGKGPFALLAAVEAPAFLIETGMVSNAGDASRLSAESEREALAGVLAKALQEAFDCGGMR